MIVKATRYHYQHVAHAQPLQSAHCAATASVNSCCLSWALSATSARRRSRICGIHHHKPAGNSSLVVIS